MVMSLAAFAIGATSLIYIYFKWISGSQPFHVDGPEAMKMKVMGVNIFPVICWVMGLLPDKTRKNLVTKEVRLPSYIRFRANIYFPERSDTSPVRPV